MAGDDDAEERRTENVERRLMRATVGRRRGLTSDDSRTVAARAPVGSPDLDARVSVDDLAQDVSLLHLATELSAERRPVKNPNIAPDVIGLSE